jgi:phage baseplate assembly protein gpV
MAARSTNAFTIFVEGNQLDETIAGFMVEAIVDDELNQPDSFELVFRDPNRTVIEQGRFTMGAKVEIKVVSEGAPEGELILQGEITALEAEVEPDRTVTVVRGYDPSHRLQRGTVTETHLDVTYGDVAGKIAQRRGLKKGNTGDNSTIHEAVIQWNQSDWDFLSALAAEIDHEVVVADGELHFRPPAESSEAPEEGDLEADNPRQLTFGRNLLRLRAVVTAAEQIEEVQVRSWDVKNKEAIEGTARQQSAARSARSGADPSDLAKTFSGGTLTYPALAVISKEMADATAGSLAQQVASACSELDGVAQGNPSLRAGTTVSLSNVGKPFDGRYVITSCRHTYDPEQGYLTGFRVSGRQKRSILGLVNGGGGDHHHAEVGGVVPGLVSNIEDPEQLGRVKVSFPWLADQAESHWLRVASPGGGPKRGMLFLPEVGDEVLVGFAHGDPRTGFVLGGLHNGKDDPPLPMGELLSNGEVVRRPIVSRKGHRMVLDDTDDQVLLSSSDDKFTLVLDQKGTKVVITSDGDVEIEAKKEVKIKSGTNLKIEASQSMEIKAANGVKIDAGGGNLEAKGVQATIEGSAQAELKGGATAKVSGAMVQIN